MATSAIKIERVCTVNVHFDNSRCVGDRLTKDYAGPEVTKSILGSDLLRVGWHFWQLLRADLATSAFGVEGLGYRNMDFVTFARARVRLSKAEA